MQSSQRPHTAPISMWHNSTMYFLEAFTVTAVNFFLLNYSILQFLPSGRIKLILCLIKWFSRNTKTSLIETFSLFSVTSILDILYQACFIILCK